MDFGAAQEERQADVPVSLFAGAEDGYGVDIRAAFEEKSGGKGGAETGELRGGKERVRSSGRIEESEGAVGGASLRGCNGRLGRSKVGGFLGRVRTGC